MFDATATGGSSMAAAGAASTAAGRGASRGIEPWSDRNDEGVEIAHHWSTLPEGARALLLAGPKEVDALALFDFWITSHHIQLHGNDEEARALRDASHRLAVHYLRRGQSRVARNLILNAAFVQDAQRWKLPRGRVMQSYMTRMRSAYPSYYKAEEMTASPEGMRTWLKIALPTTEQHRKVAHKGKWSGNHNGLVTRKSTAPKAEGTVAITMLDDGVYHTDIGWSTPLKSLFSEYSQARGVSLRSLRFSYEGKPLFPSAVKNRTPDQLGLVDSVTITVTAVEDESDDSGSAHSAREKPPKERAPKKQQRKAKTKKKKTKNKRVTPLSSQPLVAEKTEEDLKIEHSTKLTKIHDEAQPQFKQIRQHLNALTLERSPPKAKMRRSKSEPLPEPADSPPTAGLGGKAGKPRFLVQVGEVQNLYKTSKGRSLSARETISIDLHGCTKAEALDLLDSNLPVWYDAAMTGAYPFVVPVEIICGCGRQVVSEAVEEWIRTKDNVSNAPKNLRAA